MLLRRRNRQLVQSRQQHVGYGWAFATRRESVELVALVVVEATRTPLRLMAAMARCCTAVSLMDKAMVLTSGATAAV